MEESSGDQNLILAKISDKVFKGQRNRITKKKRNNKDQVVRLAKVKTETE